MLKNYKNIASELARINHITGRHLKILRIPRGMAAANFLSECKHVKKGINLIITTFFQ